MRKIVATPDAGGVALTLGDTSAGDGISGGEPQAKGEVQTVQYFRAAATTRFYRGNVANSMKWTVSRVHADEQTADDFRADHPQAVAQLGSCTVQDIGPADSRYFANAIIIARCTHYSGQSTEFEYTMEAGLESTTAP